MKCQSSTNLASRDHAFEDFEPVIGLFWACFRGLSLVWGPFWAYLISPSLVWTAILGQFEESGSDLGTILGLFWESKSDKGAILGLFLALCGVIGPYILDLKRSLWANFRGPFLDHPRDMMPIDKGGRPISCLLGNTGSGMPIQRCQRPISGLSRNSKAYYWAGHIMNFSVPNI